MTDGANTTMAMVTITVNPVVGLPVVLLIALAIGAGLTTVVVAVLMIRRSRSDAIRELLSVHRATRS